MVMEINAVFALLSFGVTCYIEVGNYYIEHAGMDAKAQAVKTARRIQGFVLKILILYLTFSQDFFCIGTTFIVFSYSLILY